MILKTLLISVLLCSISCYPLEDLVDNLPDYPTGVGRLFSGYLQVGDTEKNLFYVLAESQGNPQEDPLVIWLNGGPGCSSLLGFSQENGPAVFKGRSKVLVANPYSWNKFASIIYLDAPTNVGFSYGNPDETYTFDDNSTADDNLQAVLSFFEKYPEFKTNKFYVAGESYGGIYAPYLVDRILTYNEKASAEDKINLAGLTVGNGLTDKAAEFGRTEYKFAIDHDITSDDDTDAYNNSCVSGKENSTACEEAKGSIAEKYFFNNVINMYDIYRKCDLPRSEQAELAKGKGGINPKTFDYAPWAFSRATTNVTYNFVPCLDFTGPVYYFNRPDVQAALHVQPGLTWTPCGPNKNFIYEEFLPNEPGSLHLYPRFLENKLRIMFYSGNTDNAVPINGSRDWIAGLNMTISIANEWNVWRINPLEVAGWVSYYDQGFVFVAVHGVGHMVPQWKPQAAAKMYKAFLDNDNLANI